MRRAQLRLIRPSLHFIHSLQAKQPTCLPFTARSREAGLAFSAAETRSPMWEAILCDLRIEIVNVAASVETISIRNQYDSDVWQAVEL